jgi:hypothetical protein
MTTRELNKKRTAKKQMKRKVAIVGVASIVTFYAVVILGAIL